MSAENAVVLHNKIRTNKFISLMLTLVTTVVHLALLALTIMGIFKINTIFLGASGILSTTLGIIAYSLARQEKHVDLVAVINILVATIITGVLGSNGNINIVLSYIFPFVIACLYLERKFMLISFVIVPINIMASIFFRLMDKFPQTYMDVLWSYWAAYILEILIMVFVFNLLNKRIVALFHNLVDTKEQANMLESIRYAKEKSTEISTTLHASLLDLNESVESSAATNEAIAESATQAERDSHENLNYVHHSIETVNQISRGLNEIAETSTALLHAFKTGYEKTELSYQRIQSTENTMNLVTAASSETKKAMDQLMHTSEDINQIIEEISGIASQTSLLALNASIEAARAGDLGRGFVVVAQEVKKLSEESSNSTDKISQLISQLNASTKSAISAVQSTMTLMESGIQEVYATRETIDDVMRLQKNTDAHMSSIVSFSEKGHVYGSELSAIIDKIQSLVEKSLNQIAEIAGDTQSQARAMEEITSSFKTIERVTQELKSI